MNKLDGDEPPLEGVGARKLILILDCFPKPWVRQYKISGANIEDASIADIESYMQGSKTIADEEQADNKKSDRKKQKTMETVLNVSVEGAPIPTKRIQINKTTRIRN